MPREGHDPAWILRYTRAYGGGVRTYPSGAWRALAIPLLVVAGGYFFFGGVGAVVGGLASFFLVRVAAFSLPPVPTRRARLEVRQNDLSMELDFIKGSPDPSERGRESKDRRVAELERELGLVEAELAGRYEDWRRFLEDRQGGDGGRRVR